MFKKACANPYCKELVETGKRFCPKHDAENKMHKLRRNYEYLRIRSDKELQKFYKSSEWKSLREKKLKANPNCEVCGKPAQEVHHLVDLKDGGERLSMKNLVSLCKICHNKVHNKKIKSM